MPGPRGNYYRGINSEGDPIGVDWWDGRDPYATVHRKCRDSDRCTGPGCRIRTGKTALRRGTINR